ncbi:lamin tail domain-containing protein [Bacteroides sp.]|uniref:lamin tail domain-containing protein n=1 Tax=Bacteroides sp. TaxID=29523 RepID=UPI002FC9400D
MKRIIGITCFLSSLCSCSPVIDDLSEEMADDFTYKLAWTGDTDKFIISEQEGLRLNDKEKVAGSAFLASGSSRVRDTRWEFRTHFFFQPSVNNHARFYLISSSDNLSGPLDGYFVQIGGKDYNVSLYRQTGLKLQLLASGRELMRGNKSPDLKIKVECDANGYWTFWTCLKEESAYVKEQQVWDNPVGSSVCIGVYCFYTSSRYNGFVFSHIRVTEGVEVVTEPKPADPDSEVSEVLDEPTATLLFNEIMYHNGKDGAEYIELYNHSEESVSLVGLQVEKLKLDGSAILNGTMELTEGTSTPSVVAPGSYICFTQSPKTIVNKHQVEQVRVVRLSNFLPLSDKGGYLVLRSKEGKLIDRCYFGDQVHSIPASKAIGIALEKRSPRLVSDKISNWTSSGHATGGTPGIKNSVVKMR